MSGEGSDVSEISRKPGLLHWKSRGSFVSWVAVLVLDWRFGCANKWLEKNRVIFLQRRGPIMKFDELKRKFDSGKSVDDKLH